MAITTPPFRTSLLTQNGVPFGSESDSIQTAKDWWLYWNQLTGRSNANSKLATAGTHGDRPMPDGMPEGALYYENDRGVLYANTLGVWQYVAGTMWGTLSPDQRPPDLGTHDAGFDFRGTDQPREFLWSQTAWVETTPVSGAVNLTHPNAVTKVGSTQGQIVEGGITDLSAGNSGVMNISAAGNVGVGMIPAAALDVAGTVRSTGASSPASGAGIELVYSGGAGFIVAYDRSAGAYHSLQINGSLTILPSGNVGIGTGGPGSKLSVVGLPTSAAGLTSGDIWRDPAAGNVLKIVP